MLSFFFKTELRFTSQSPNLLSETDQSSNSHSLLITIAVFQYLFPFFPAFVSCLEVYTLTSPSSIIKSSISSCQKFFTSFPALQCHMKNISGNLYSISKYKNITIIVSFTIFFIYQYIWLRLIDGDIQNSHMRQQHWGGFFYWQPRKLKWPSMQTTPLAVGFFIFL